MKIFASLSRERFVCLLNSNFCISTCLPFIQQNGWWADQLNTILCLGRITIYMTFWNTKDFVDIYCRRHAVHFQYTHRIFILRVEIPHWVWWTPPKGCGSTLRMYQDVIAVEYNYILTLAILDYLLSNSLWYASLILLKQPHFVPLSTADCRVSFCSCCNWIHTFWYTVFMHTFH